MIPGGVPADEAPPSVPAALLAEHSAEELYEEAPCGYVSMLPDGTLVKVNRTFLRSTGYDASELVGRRRLQDMLTPGSKLFHATHWGPRLELEGAVSEIPVDIVCADDSRLTVLLNAVVARSSDGTAAGIRASLFDATDRRRYERELVAARDVERTARERVERLQRITVALSDALDPPSVGRAVIGELVQSFGAGSGRLIVETPAGSEVAHEEASRRRRRTSRPAAAITRPLLIDGQRLGALEVDLAEPRIPTPEEEAFLRSCVAQCGQALRRAQLFREVEQRSAQESAVARISAMALDGMELEDLFEKAVEAVRETLDADRSAIVRHRSDDDEVVVAAAPDGSQGGDARRRLSVVIGPRSGPFGALTVQAGPMRRFSAAERSFVAAVANVLWNAIERRRVNEITQHQAMHDALTGLPNRWLLQERLAHEIARARRDGSSFAVVLLDLDFFKFINDSFGHLTGDDLLRAVADRLSAAVRDVDMVVRLGGDEFVVVAPDIGSRAAGGELARRVADVLSRPFTVRGADHVVGASVGVMIGTGGDDPEGLLRDADIAMYAAKERGRGQHAVFDESMREQAQEHLRVEAELREALRNDELQVHYQPVMSTSDRRLVSMEALVRWQHPRRGLVPPGVFIPVAEATGLIVDVGRFVLEQACAQLVSWRAEGVIDPDVSVAVNVSARQLAQSGLAAEVAAIMASTGLDANPGLLGLEITETVLMDSGEFAPTVLGELSALGVGLLLDDFGTGASSLARLKRFPVDTLKIDRAFISGLGGPDDEDHAIVAAVMGLAVALGLRVVAEGVETERQLACLRDLDCDRVQGFLFSRPLPAADMRAFAADAASRSLTPSAS